MKPAPLTALPAVLRENKAAIFAHWRVSVCELPGAANLDGPALRDHIPQFIDEMIIAIARHEEEVADGGPGSPVEHGMQRLNVGFDIKEVVIEYNILRGAVHHVVENAGLLLGAADWRVVNHIIDDAIAWAVDTFAKEQAAEIQRRRDEHFAFIAHDVRTPLNAISLTTDLLADELGTDTQSSDMLRALKRNVRRIDDMIRRIMQHESHSDAADDMKPLRRDIDLWPLVQLLAGDMRAVAEVAGARIINSVPRHLTAAADAGLLARAFQNLIGNAIKFTQGGSVEIGADAAESGVECWVRDSGRGIEPERLSRIFEKGETDSDPAKAGSGLGLTIFKQIVEAHGGTISVTSRPGNGTEFRFSIPRPPEA